MERNEPSITNIQERILDGLSDGKYYSKDMLSEKTNIPPTTIWQNLYKLKKLGLVKKEQEHSMSVGRPRTLWKIREGENE